MTSFAKVMSGPVQNKLVPAALLMAASVVGVGSASPTWLLFAFSDQAF